MLSRVCSLTQPSRRESGGRFMSTLIDRESLELRTNQRRERVSRLVDAIDARRHPHLSARAPSSHLIAAAVTGAVGAIVAFLLATRPARAWWPLVGGATAGGIAIAIAVARRSKPALPAPSSAALREHQPFVERVHNHRLPVKQGPEPRRRGARVAIAIAVVVLSLFVAARIALNPVAAWATQKGLDGLSGYQGEFKSVKVSLFPLRFTVEDLRLVQDGTEVEDAVLTVKKLVATAKWTDVVRGRLIASARADHAHLKVMLGQTEAPPEVQKAAKEGSEKLARNEFDVAKTLEAVVPFRVDRLELADAEVTLIDATDPKQPRIWLNDIEFVAENIANRDELDQRAPLMLTGRATVQKTGVLKLLVVADLLDEKPAFTGQAQLIGLNLESLYQWAAAKAGLSPHGSVNVFVNFNSAKGALGGDVKVLARNVRVDPLEGKFSNAMKAAAANAAFNILKDEEKGQQVGTTLPIRGSLVEPDAQLWPAVIGVLRNAFVDSLNWGFGSLPVGTASKKENVLEQAVKGLDKKEPGPKAQPGGGT